jgi:hypothetical protein
MYIYFDPTVSNPTGPTTCMYKLNLQNGNLLKEIKINFPAGLSISTEGPCFDNE